MGKGRLGVVDGQHLEEISLDPERLLPKAVNRCTSHSNRHMSERISNPTRKDSWSGDGVEQLELEWALAWLWSLRKSEDSKRGPFISGLLIDPYRDAR